MEKKEQMSAEAIEARRKYQREYYAANKEKRKAYDARRWEKKAAQEKQEGDNGGS